MKFGTDVHVRQLLVMLHEMCITINNQSTAYEFTDIL